MLLQYQYMMASLGTNQYQVKKQDASAAAKAIANCIPASGGLYQNTNKVVDRCSLQAYAYFENRKDLPF
jgi:hypothetical protein